MGIHLTVPNFSPGRPAVRGFCLEPEIYPGAENAKGLRGSSRQALIAWTAGSRPVPSLRLLTLSSVERSRKTASAAACSLPDHRNDLCDHDSVLIAKLDGLARNVAFIANLMDGKVDFVCCDMPEATHSRSMFSRLSRSMNVR
jgi:hypothetical protein